MGDTIEITTWPKHQNLFYRITSSGLAFDVKAPADAGIGLAMKPGDKCDYWVGIGERNDRSWIKKELGESKTVNTPNILKFDESRRFWITWNGGNIQLGRHGETKPIVTLPNDLTNLNYVTFCCLAGNVHGNPAVHWRFEIPPVIETPKMRPVPGGKLHWVPAQNQLPDDALIGGYEKSTLYIIRAHHRGSLTPGKFVPSEGVGYISWGGDSHEKQEFEVLCGFDCIWVPTYEAKIPVDAFEGGYSEDGAERMYVGRAEHKGFLIPGKVQPSHKVCYIPFEGKEIAKKHFEILVEPFSNKRCVNKCFTSDIRVETASESESDHDNSDEDYYNSDGEADDNYPF